jgi:cephalosporin-C deacetylase-like acetyl esterase
MISHSAQPKAVPLKGVAARAAAKKNERELPGYFTDGISDPSAYYVKGVYCDLLRAVDFLRLNRKLDCSSMAVIGKGIGAAAALYCASVCDRITALVLDSPAFVNLDEWNNNSEGDIAAEIADYLRINPSSRQRVKENLSYFDALNFSESVSCDVLMAVGLRDVISPARCSLALFNHLLCDKTIEVYPDEGNEAGGEKQFRKSLAWIRKRLSE